MSDDISAQYAAFVANARPEDLPASVRHDAERSLLNNFAAAFSGCQDAAVVSMLKVIEPWSGPRLVGVFGRSERLDILNGAWINAAIANVLDFDDTHLPTVIHPTSPIAAALFAFAEHRSASGRTVSGADFIHAFALGVEVACRVGNAVSPGHYNRGWHITGTCGVLGAAAGVARLLGLDAERTRWALANAATQASGLVETLGFNSKSLNPANAARGGLLSALAAEAGLSGPMRPIEGLRGFLNVFGVDPVISRLTDKLGETWELSINALKPYPCGVVLHPVIDACLDIRARENPTAGSIERIVVRGNSLLKARADRKVTTGREAQVCLSHTVAAAFLRGKASVPEFTDECVNDPAIRAFGEFVVMQVDDSVPVEAARVTVSLKDGRKLEAYVPHARGSIGRPLTDAEIEKKVVELSGLYAPAIQAQRLIDTAWSFQRAPDATALSRLATLSPG